MMNPHKNGKKAATRTERSQARKALSTTRRSLGHLMAGTAIGLLWVSYSAPAEAACNISGSTMLCSGAVSGGIAATDPVTMLTISSLTSNVTAPAGTDAVNFVSSNGAITVILNTDQTLNASGAGADAIEARSLGGHDITVNATGGLNSANAYGIYGDTAGDISVTTNGAIHASLDALNLHGQSTGNVVINTTGSLVSDTGSGIVADTGIDPSLSGMIKVVNGAAITAAGDGIRLTSNGSGLLDIGSTGNITADSGYGIYGFGNGSIVSQTSGSIESDQTAISLEAHGQDGPIIASHTGNLTSHDGDGFWAEARGPVSISVTGDIEADGTGIHAQSAETVGTTVVDIRHNGEIKAYNGYGIEAVGLNGGISITNNGTIRSLDDGITATASGGDVTVNQIGTIMTDGRGIFAHSTTDNVAVTGTGAISAEGDGVVAYANNGTASVQQTGDISSDGIGINITSLTSDASVTGSGTISASGTGISASSLGYGSTNIDRTGDIESTGDIAILATSSNGNVTVSNSGIIQAQANGIQARAANGDIEITQTGAVTSTAGSGIDAAAQNGSVTLTTDGLITASGHAIRANSGGYGTVEITASGGLTSSTGAGIFAASANGNITISNSGTIQAATAGIDASAANAGVSVTNTGIITAGEDAIRVNNSGNGQVTINTSNNLTSTNNSGILVTSGSYGVNITSSSVIASKQSGIDVEAINGDVQISQTANVTSSAARAISADALNGAVSIASNGALQAKTDGIYAHSKNGNVGVNQTGTIVATDGAGIIANAESGSVTLTANGLITANEDAVRANSAGYGTIGITTSGGIHSVSGTGIVATATNGNVTVSNTGAIQASADGINVEATNGAIQITQTGNVTSDNGVAIRANAPNDNISITSTGNLSGETYGVYAHSNGWDTSVSQTGTVYSEAGAGIDAYSANGQVSVIANGAVTAKTDAILARSASGGDVTVNATGGVEAYDGAGIIAYSASGKVDVTQNGNVLTKGNAIDVSNVGYQSVSIAHSNGTITSYSGSGILISSVDGAVNVTSSGAITAELYGINASNTGNGAVSVSQTGAVTANHQTGILASSATGSVTVTGNGNIEAELYGITASNAGNGSVSVSQTGAVTANHQTGILASSATGSVTVTGNGNITAELYGINASNAGNGSVFVSQTGAVTAYHQTGILASSATGAVTVTGNADITADRDGINASNTSNNNAVTVDQQGVITAYNGTGILASSAQAAVNVTHTGNIVAGVTGINAANLSDTEAVTVRQEGDTTAADGIIASSARAAVTVTNVGVIKGNRYGINATNMSDNAAVTVNNTGDITARDADAIFAASSNANVNVTSSGDLTAKGNGLYLQGWGQLSANVNGGTVSGGTDGAAVAFVNGSSSSLVNRGTLQNSQGIDGLAIAATNTNTAIDNYGTVRGNVDLTDLGSNSFLNRFDALFETGSRIDLGAGNLLTNEGTLSPGGAGTIETTNLIGSLNNTANGTLLIDIDASNNAVDKLEVAGNATLNGTLGLNFISFGRTGTYTFLTSGTGIGTETMALSNPVINGSISSDGTNATVTIDGFNFSPSGSVVNSSAIGDYLNRSFATTSGLEPILSSLASLSSLDAFNEAMQQLSPEVFLAQSDAAKVANVGFTNNLMSCRVADGAVFFGAEGECGWMKVERRLVSRDETADSVGFDNKSWTLSSGAQFAVADDWRIGFGFGLSTETATSAYGSSDGTSGYAGAVVKYTPGAALFAASISSTYGWYDTTRNVNFGSLSDTLTGSPEVATLNARLRAAYTFQNHVSYLRPQVELDMIYTHQNAVTESGGVSALSLQSNDQTVFSVTPSLEAGAQFEMEDNVLIRPYVSGGVSLYSSDEQSIQGVFSANTGGISPFTARSTTDRTLWRASAGVDIFATENSTLRLYYDGAFGSTTTSQTFGGKFSLKF
ncbi:Uncharacterized conserved protein, contains a C-terminal beta-barrel porin domain [Rhizobium sp. RU35A]|uniref:hypothetical protein n=1 Tax=Rhizobium sp. RU35A TaxID=1907414 RepID=UPI000954CCE7|nr:hypothetical protein [Rhizobium sp. RU35A]SIQ35389.1 Uncharacterized conserved protein, contains a C-terminal beta-barrel porin domain [Rhizobium sp. RU35A]